MLSALASGPETKLCGDDAVGQLLHLIEALVITLTSDGEIKDCNGTCEELSGFSLAELSGRNFARTFAILQEVDLLHEKVQVLATHGALDRFEAFLLTKLGEPKRIRWSGIRLDTPEEPGETLLFSGIDVTGQYEALLQLAKTEQEAVRLKRNLSELRSKDRLNEKQDCDRRADRRLYFPHRQRVAPYEDHNQSIGNSFVEVDCRNIAAKGIAFYLDEAPTARQFVVELGSGSHAIYLTAEVKHSTLVHCEGRERFLVGCRFARRITE